MGNARRHRWAITVWLAVSLLACSSGTGVQDNLHGGPQNPARDGSYTEAIISSNGIASLEPVMLGGVEQWVLIRGYDVNNPILVFLHGGPGSPAIHYARFAFKQLERHFTVVTWDQRGCGKSYDDGIDPQSITFDQLLLDTHELIEMMRVRFGVEKVYLMGISWGSILGVHTTKNHPALLSSYIGIGQVVNLVQGFGISLDFALEQARALGNDDAIAELTAVQAGWQADSTFSWERAAPVLGWLEAWGYGDLHDTSLYASLGQEAGPLTEYTDEDWANEQRWRALYDASPLEADLSWWVDFDLSIQIPRLDAPVVFLSGRFDYKAPLELVEAYVTGLEAPAGKQLVTFEESAHVVFLEQRDLFRSTMIETVLVGPSHHARAASEHR
jgi:pimeloyl-ACP methyl ester carboxylesterase